MKTSSSCIGWKTGVFSLIILTLLFIGVIGYQSDAASDMTLEPQGVEYPIPENAQPRIIPATLVEKGKGLRFNVNDQGDVVNMMSPLITYLPKDIKNYKQYYQLLVENTQRLQKYYQTEGGNLADCLECHLKITIGKRNEKAGAYPIVKVEQLNEEEFQTLMQRRKDARDNNTVLEKTERRGLKATMTKGAAQAFFRLFKSISCDRYSGTPCLTFQYAADGCQARAHYMRKLLEGNGYACQKIFAIEEWGGLQAYAKAGCCVQWGWHVAPVVKVRDGSSITNMVLDPSICDEPVPISTWINLMKTGCTDGRRVNVFTAIRPASDYSPMSRTEYSQDPDYSFTEDLLDEYRNKSGCVE